MGSLMEDFDNARRVPMIEQRQVKALPDKLPSVPGMPLELVPAGLRDWLADVSDRAQSPVEFVAIPAIVALSGIVGRAMGIYPKRYDSWLVVPNLWGVIVGRPSTIKTHMISEGLKPLRKLAARAVEEHKQGSFAVEAQILAVEARLDEARSKLKTAARANTNMTDTQADIEALLLQKDTLDQGQIERRYFTNDPTIEMVGKLLNENPRGITIVRDELSGWFRLLDKSGREGDREFYLEGWNGTGSYTYDRIGRGTLHVPALTVSLIGGIQPSKLRPYISSALNGGQGDDGLLQRMQMLVWPDHPKGWHNVDRAPDHEAERRAFDIIETLDLLVGADNGDGEIPALRFNEAAQELFDQWRDELENRLCSDEFSAAPAFEAHLGKYRSLMPSLALLFHLIDVAGQPVVKDVTLEAALMAAKWCEFLEKHARKVYAPELNVSLASAYGIVEKIGAGEIKDGDTVREIYRHGWSGLETVENVRAGLEILQAHNFVWTERKQTAGAPSEVICIHPDVLRGQI